jgi:hypothetical protein
MRIIIENKDNKTKDKKTSQRRHVELFENTYNYLYRRAFSEMSLLDACKTFEFQLQHSYNFITGGDVDMLSYLKVILRQQNLKYCLSSTWCMAAEDVVQFGEWLKQGRIEKLDFYLGEIFPNQYKIEYKMLKNIFEKYKCGRMAIFKNHSKIFAGYGEKFPFAIQTSANINTNPRTENACITIDEGLFKFYKSYFDGIISFDKENKNFGENGKQ